MSLLSKIAAIFNPAAKLIDDLHTSDEERMQLRNEFHRIKNSVALEALAYDKLLTEKQADVVMAEAQGHSWLQRNWRPITMMTFLVLIVLDCFGLLVFRLADGAWKVLMLGLGGYTIGRSAERCADKIGHVFKKENGS